MDLNLKLDLVASFLTLTRVIWHYMALSLLPDKCKKSHHPHSISIMLSWLIDYIGGNLSNAKVNNFIKGLGQRQKTRKMMDGVPIKVISDVPIINSALNRVAEKM